MKKVIKTVKKVKQYLSTSIFDPDNDNFGRFAKGMRAGIMEQVVEFEEAVDRFSILKLDVVKEKHWMEITKLLGFKDTTFTFSDLISSPYIKYQRRIENLILQGKTD